MYFLQVGDLLSYLGGTVGLWLGFSVITLFEFVELFWDLWAVAICKCAEKKKQRTVRAEMEIHGPTFDEKGVENGPSLTPVKIW